MSLDTNLWNEESLCKGNEKNENSYPFIVFFLEPSLFSLDSLLICYDGREGYKKGQTHGACPLLFW